MTYQNRAIEIPCPECGTLFVTHVGRSSSQYCSDSCSGRESDENRIEQLSKVLRAREAWRYVQVNTYLNEQNVPHQFEYPLGNYIFDLALTDDGVLIEFDEPYHDGVVQSTKDLKKDSFAEDNRWSVVRVPVETNEVISVESIQHIINICN